MWKCPKCGRSFKKQNQDHYCGKAPETIDEYIAAQPEEAQRYLNQASHTIGASRGTGADFLEYACLLEGTQYHPFCRL